jgi:glycosyltransferase involved in cell wall biosynthesis
MHIAFAHDHVFYEDVAGQVHSRGGQLGHVILRRYIDVFGNVTVLARSQPLAPDEHVEGMSRADGPGLSFRLLREGRGGLNRVRGFSARRAMLVTTLAGVDGLVARLPSVMGSEACRVAERMGVPWAVEVVGSVWDGLVAQGNLAAKVYAPIAHLRTRALVSRAGAALYVTQSFLQRGYPTRAPSIGVSDVDLPDPLPDTLAARLARIESRPSPLRVGLVGSVASNHKGIDTVLRALAKVRERLGAFEFWVLGYGDPARYLELAGSLGIAPFVKFCGTLPAGAPVRRWLDAVDVYVQPSRTEGLPRSLLEALSRGCPALGSRVGGIPELLEPRCLHRPGDDSALGELLLRVSEPSLMLQLARRNFSLASEFAARDLDARRREFWASFANRICTPPHGKCGPSEVRELGTARSI